MKILVAATLYAAVTLGANPVLAGGLDIDALREMRAGDMRKLAFHAVAKDPVVVSFVDKDGAEMDISAFKGKVILLNFWATWCAPCRKEMPMLEALEKELGGEDFAVVTMATGRNPVPMIEAFFAKINVTSLPILRDPKQAYARRMAVLGLPMTMILDRQGREVARLRGDAEWDSADAVAILRAVIAADTPDS
ncbi:MAG: TlpA family protein disulfide reductase [Rhodobacteraceae bacterium]|nr:TlpA family protein disulfide reductase [Paracoccaceae bacterium]